MKKQIFIAFLTLIAISPHKIAVSAEEFEAREAETSVPASDKDVAHRLLAKPRSTEEAHTVARVHSPAAAMAEDYADDEDLAAFMQATPVANNGSEAAAAAAGPVDDNNTNNARNGNSWVDSISLPYSDRKAQIGQTQGGRPISSVRLPYLDRNLKTTSPLMQSDYVSDLSSRNASRTQRASNNPLRAAASPEDDSQNNGNQGSGQGEPEPTVQYKPTDEFAKLNTKQQRLVLDTVKPLYDSVVRFGSKDVTAISVFDKYDFLSPVEKEALLSQIAELPIEKIVTALVYIKPNIAAELFKTLQPAQKDAILSQIAHLDRGVQLLAIKLLQGSIATVPDAYRFVGRTALNLNGTQLQALLDSEKAVLLGQTTSGDEPKS